MIYDEFKTTILTEVTSRIDRSCTVTLHEVLKNNHTILDGLMIASPLVNIAPTIYLNPYYHRYLEGVSIADIVEDIVSTYEHHTPVFNINTEFFTDFANIRPKIVMKLVNYEKNQLLLKDVPYQVYLDLAVIFQIVLKNPADEETGTITIHNDHLDLWGVTEKELYQAALTNTPELLPFDFFNIVRCIDHLMTEGGMGESLSETDLALEEASTPMFVLTNRQRTNGAACLLYPGLLERIADSFRSDLIILPSSIHETILVPLRNEDPHISWDSYNEMVENINETELADEDILSDHAYYYEKKTGKVTAVLPQATPANR